METVYLNQTNLEYWKNKAKFNVMALGFFDGLHKGHQKVIQTAAKIAKERGVSLAVMSFFPHPKTVLSKGKVTFDYIMPLMEKEKVLEQMGVDTFYIVEFNKSFASLSPEEYVSNYLVDFNVVHVVAGFDFSYGKFGAGHVDRMEKDSNGRLGITKVAKVDYQGKKISSTWIRQMILSGNMEELPSILGRPYKLECKYNGSYFEPLPQYILPPPGRYSVTIDSGYQKVVTEVVVLEDRGTIQLLGVNEANSYSGDRVSIIWHRCVQSNAMRGTQGQALRL